MNRRLLAAALALACVALFAAPAEARQHHRSRHVAAHHHSHHAHHRPISRVHAARHERGDPRPAAWCGWQVRQWLGVRNLAGNVARWWAGFGRPAHGPGEGVIVVWPHHVGIITGRIGGLWIVKSGNDGHRIRERPRSLDRAIAFRIPE